MSMRITPLTDPDRGPFSRRLAWLASEAGGAPVGSAFLRLPTGPGQEHQGELELNVHPAERRNRVGSRLLKTVVAAARKEGRRHVVAQAEAGSAGDRFLAASGFRKVLTLTYARLTLASADIAALTGIVEQPHPGYRLESWQGSVPGHLAQTFAAARRAMDDMPMDEADHVPVTWDVERVRAAARIIEQRGDLLHTVVAVDTSDNSIAGFTELVVPGGGKGDGQHYGTGVLPEHRGHGLGRWMKAESIRHARQHHPDLDGLTTDTAAGNAPMRHINDSLGYLPTHQVISHRLDL
ncbi:GNAT family N-acetyltransferase [Streptomyces sp. TRM70350]|uniref:GNAT family N-acetyltransferase n=1 Tax=Streptomyces sp. TRM70350 TaxID=2856165 RepID=UPI001C4927AA|nr:GNAT family N-acetyltransferase [Streptomyces sp. TRM70350]MBV7697863.1 GNAT family N-acetyltransferase [Streptomyces sp. TRM70350]